MAIAYIANILVFTGRSFSRIADTDSGCTTFRLMGTLTIRTDPEVERALASLTSEGQ